MMKKYWLFSFLMALLTFAPVWADESEMLSQDLAVPFAFQSSATSQTLKADDHVPIKVTQDVLWNHTLVFKKDTLGWAEVDHAVHKAKNWGPTGQIYMQTAHVPDVHGVMRTLSFNFAIRGNRIIGCDAYYATSILPLITRYYTPQYIVETLPAALTVDKVKKREAQLSPTMVVQGYVPEGEAVFPAPEDDMDTDADTTSTSTALRLSQLDQTQNLSGSVTTSSMDMASATLLKGYVEKADTPPAETVTYEPNTLTQGPIETIQSVVQHRNIIADVQGVDVQETPYSPARERIRRDYVMLWSYGGGFGNGVFKNIETATYHDGPWRNLQRNFTDPTRVVQGYWEHGLSVRTNYIAHPMLWSRMGTLDQTWGASHKETVVLGFFSDMMWKWVIEGTYHAQAPQSEIVDFWSVAMSMALRNTPVGHLLTSNSMKYERFGLKHNISIVPTFADSISPAGGVRNGTVIVWAIR